MNTNEILWLPAHMVLSAPNLSEEHRKAIVQVSDTAIQRMLGRNVAYRMVSDPPQFLPIKWPKWRAP